MKPHPVVNRIEINNPRENKLNGILPQGNCKVNYCFIERGINLFRISAGHKAAVL